MCRSLLVIDAVVVATTVSGCCLLHQEAVVYQTKGVELVTPKLPTKPVLSLWQVGLITQYTLVDCTLHCTAVHISIVLC